LLSINTSTLFGQDNKIQGAVAIIQDVTKVKKMEDIMRQKQRLTLIGEMAAKVAHEIRNPLNAIAITSQRLGEEFELNSKANGFINIIKNEIQRLNKIVEEFLALARPMRLSFKKVDINVLIKEIINLFENELKNKNITLIKELNKVPVFKIDENEIKKALLNIIRNGIEAMEDGGKLSISTKFINKECKIIITDTGVGISKEDMGKIFTPYFSQKNGGVGLGLSIAHRIITEHKGNIEVESTKGRGTKFIITLPIYE
jgi:signal transduction histidine kinase